jgi:hypothetical protein
MIRRPAALAMLALFLVSLAACVVEPIGPGPHGPWIPGHYSGWGWVPGHWG